MKIKPLAERIQAIMIHTDCNLSEFHRSTGVPYITLRGYLEGRTLSISPENAEKILSTYPEINDLYLYSGKGDMLSDERTYIKMLEQEIAIAKDRINILTKLVETNVENTLLKEMVENLKAAQHGKTGTGLLKQKDSRTPAGKRNSKKGPRFEGQDDRGTAGKVITQKPGNSNAGQID